MDDNSVSAKSNFDSYFAGFEKIHFEYDAIKFKKTHPKSNLIRKLNTYKETRPKQVTVVGETRERWKRLEFSLINNYIRCKFGEDIKNLILDSNPTYKEVGFYPKLNITPGQIGEGGSSRVR